MDPIYYKDIFTKHKCPKKAFLSFKESHKNPALNYRKKQEEEIKEASRHWFSKGKKIKRNQPVKKQEAETKKALD